jgi:hypothetical protein
MTTIKPASIVNPVTPIGDNGSIFVPFVVDTYSGNKGSLRTSLPIDRYGTLNILTYSGSLGNHNYTDRISYTVPSDKYGILIFVYMSIGIPSTSGECDIIVQINSVTFTVHLIISTSSNDRRFKELFPNIYLPSGTTILSKTYNSTSSTVGFYNNIGILEFSC